MAVAGPDALWKNYATTSYKIVETRLLKDS